MFVKSVCFNLISALFLIAALSGAGLSQDRTATYAPDQVIVRLEHVVSLKDAQLLLDGSLFEVREALVPALDVFLVRLSEKLTVPDAIRLLKGWPGVRWVQADHYLSLRTTTPDDPLFSSLWSLEQASDADVDAAAAWDISTGGTDPGGNDIVVAVVDNGCKISHADLQPNLWVNEDEIPGNSIDDDGNGYVDDINGWDAYANDGSIPEPANHHGTHVTGIVGARGNNTLQVCGVNWNVKLMIVAGSSSTTSIVARAYNYVLTQKTRWLSSGGFIGANVVAANSSFGKNATWCTADSFPIWNDLYDAMGAAGILSACATANAAWDVDVNGDIPTSCTSPYIISVTNTTSSDLKNSGSAWGETYIDLGAPGSYIVSTINTGTGTLSGTSMATPHVSGTVALMHAAASPGFYRYYLNHPDSAALLLKQIILDGVDPLSGFDTLTVSGGRLNLNDAVQTVHGYIAPEPFLVYDTDSIEDQTSGDGDGYWEAGEVGRLFLTVLNFGADVQNVTAELSTSDPYAVITDSLGSFGNIPANGSGVNSADPFEIAMSPMVPLFYSIPVSLTLTADGSYSVTRHFSVILGRLSTYWSDSVETGENGWTHANVEDGFGDQWHLTTETSSSPTQAWKCGDSGAGNYQNRLDAALISPALVIQPHTWLAFSHRLDAEDSGSDSAFDGGVIEIAAVDSPYAEVIPDGGYDDTFQTTRNGLYFGPLPGRRCFSGYHGWMTCRADLSDYAGQTVHLRFRFGSDSVRTFKGWYVDDIRLMEAIPLRASIDAIDDAIIQVVGDDIQIAWTPFDYHVDYFVVYRNSDPDFTPTSFDSIGWTSDTTYVDTGVVLDQARSFYLVKAFVR